MTDLTKQERERIAAALERDITRLQSLVNDYRQARGNTRNAAVRAMADEGTANVAERIAELCGLVANRREAEAGVSPVRILERVANKLGWCDP